MTIFGLSKKNLSGEEKKAGRATIDSVTIGKPYQLQQRNAKTPMFSALERVEPFSLKCRSGEGSGVQHTSAQRSAARNAASERRRDQRERRSERAQRTTRKNAHNLARSRARTITARNAGQGSAQR